MANMAGTIMTNFCLVCERNWESIILFFSSDLVKVSVIQLL